jgi:hypothetical protein
MLAIAPIWIMVSLAVEVLGNAAFVLWLRRQGAKVRFGWAGMPIYVDWVYVEWCRAQGRQPGKLLLLRRISLINAAAAAFLAIPLLSR